MLSCIPQVVCFDRRAEVFFTVLSKDRDSRAGARQPGRGLGIRIRRDWIFEDSFRSFTSIASGRGGSLKDRFQVEFIDENGRPEPGIDGGGVFKEYMDTLARRAFDPQFGLFKETDERHLYPNPSSASSSAKHISHFEFLGRVRSSVRALEFECLCLNDFYGDVLVITRESDRLKCFALEFKHQHSQTGTWQSNV